MQIGKIYLNIVNVLQPILNAFYRILMKNILLNINLITEIYISEL
jgi:hypothetical protein